MIDTFSGIGGFSLAARWLGGFETVQFVEREPFCQRILAKHWPDVPIHDDICTYSPAAGVADVVAGGFPCTDISTAGKQAGIKIGTRSGLFYELMRIIRVVGPRYVVLENVAAIVNGGLDIVLGELAEAGFDAEWACIKAIDVGACHRRDRWWLVAYRPGRDTWHADTHSLRGELWGEAGNMAGTAGAGEVDGKQRQRNGNAADDCGAAIASGQLNPDWRTYISEPVLCRGNDGLSGRVDRLKALGNAVVPQVAMIPLARVLELAS